MEGDKAFPNRPQWVPDNSVTHCRQCNEEFGTRRRRHHCRNCGNVYCGECSCYRSPILELGYEEPERVCGLCFELRALSALTAAPDRKLRHYAANGIQELLLSGDNLSSDFLVKLAIPPLVNLVQGSTISMRERNIHRPVAFTFSTIARHHNYRRMMNEMQATEALLRLSRCPDSDVQRASWSALADLSIETETHKVILASGGLEQLLIAATSDSEETLTDEARLTASFVLLHLARNPEAKPVMLEDDRFLGLLLGLLQSDNVDICLSSASTVKGVVEGNDKLRIEVVNRGGLNALLDMMEKPYMSGPSTTSILATLHELALAKDNVSAFVESDAPPVLLKALMDWSQSSRVAQKYVAAIISQLVQSPVHKDHVIESLAPLISIITTECPEAEQYEAAKGLEYLLRHSPVLRELKHDDTIIKSLIRIKLTAKKASLIDAATRMLELFERESEEDNNDIPDLSTPAVKFAPNVENPTSTDKSVDPKYQTTAF